jgi:hypothetical protein
MFKSIHIKLLNKKGRLPVWPALGAISAAICIPAAVIAVIKLKKKRSVSQ